MNQNFHGEKEKASKYLTFCLGKEDYGLQILKVREIIGLMPITPLPGAPAYMRGVINLRGKVIPVVVTRKKFGMEEAPDSERTCIIVVEVKKERGTGEIGILVDAVSEVLDIAQSDIVDAPGFEGGVESHAILGVAKAKGKVKILLDIDRVLSDPAMA